jgi:hypothetical protein
VNIHACLPVPSHRLNPRRGRHAGRLFLSIIDVRTTSKAKIIPSPGHQPYLTTRDIEVHGLCVNDLFTHTPLTTLRPLVVWLWTYSVDGDDLPGCGLACVPQAASICLISTDQPLGKRARSPQVHHQVINLPQHQNRFRGTIGCLSWLTPREVGPSRRRRKVTNPGRDSKQNKSGQTKLHLTLRSSST